METNIKILSKISGEDIDTLSKLLEEEPHKFKFTITEVCEAMDIAATQVKNLNLHVGLIPNTKELNYDFTTPRRQDQIT